MNIITKALLTTSLTLGLLAGCAQPNPHPMDMTSAIQSAKTKADHEALAEHYEQAAKEAEAKVEEHKKILSQYEREPWLFGRQATGFGEHCKNLIQIYSRAMEENLEMAKMHRELAKGIKP